MTLSILCNNIFSFRITKPHTPQTYYIIQRAFRMKTFKMYQTNSSGTNLLQIYRNMGESAQSSKITTLYVFPINLIQGCRFEFLTIDTECIYYNIYVKISDYVSECLIKFKSVLYYIVASVRVKYCNVFLRFVIYFWTDLLLRLMLVFCLHNKYND